MKRRVVITGMGAVSPIGNTVEELWESVQAGRCGIGPITHFDTSAHKVKLAGEVKDLDFDRYLDKRDRRRMDLFTQYAMVAAVQAWEDSGLTPESIDPDRFGVVISSGIGGINTIETEYERGREKGFDRVSPFFVPMDISNLAAGNVAIRLGAKGMCTCVVTACAGGSNAIGDAFRMVRDGYLELAAAGGTEAAVAKLAIGGFTSMRALSESTDPARASIPFDAERSGFVMGEGAGVVMLEEYEHAVARGAHIYCEVLGYGATCDAYHITSPAPDGEGGARAMIQALQDAGISPEQIDYINAHGTSTALNDKGETMAVKTAFGEHAYRLAMSSTKSMTGHLLGAAGAVEAVILAKALEDGFIPATIGYQVPDPECDLDIVPNVGRKAELRYGMSNSLGFGGHNASLVFKRYEEA
ncbi:MAG: beta-ketoacyl-ACP synthase II [Clostridiales bacterium]|nr:beta-ketoacyl-ACP synthase II [Clostridiales bacterium]